MPGMWKLGKLEIGIQASNNFSPTGEIRAPGWETPDQCFAYVFEDQDVASPTSWVMGPALYVAFDFLLLFL